MNTVQKIAWGVTTVLEGWRTMRVIFFCKLHTLTFTNTYTVLIFSTESVKHVQPLDSFIYTQLHLIYSWKRQIWWKCHQDISKFDPKSAVVSAAPGSPDWVDILLSGAKKQQKIHLSSFHLRFNMFECTFHEFYTSLEAFISLMELQGHWPLLTLKLLATKLHPTPFRARTSCRHRDIHENLMFF